MKLIILTLAGILSGIVTGYFSFRSKNQRRTDYTSARARILAFRRKGGDAPGFETPNPPEPTNPSSVWQAAAGVA